MFHFASKTVCGSLPESFKWTQWPPTHLSNETDVQVCVSIFSSSIWWMLSFRSHREEWRRSWRTSGRCMYKKYCCHMAGDMIAIKLNLHFSICQKHLVLCRFCISYVSFWSEDANQHSMTLVVPLGYRPMQGDKALVPWLLSMGSLLCLG